MSGLLRPVFTALVISLCGGSIFKLAGIPLPWMLGPLFTVAAAGIGGITVCAPRGGRQAGQLIIGCGLGLYFTAEVSRHILHYGWYILTAACAAILIGAMGGLLLKKISGIPTVTAFFASIPGGAAEMAILAERAGARFDQVAMSHSIRILLVVTIIPISVTMSGASGSEIYLPLTTKLSVPGLIALFIMAIIAAYLFMKVGIPNAWLLGPLAVSLLLTINGQHLSAMPPFLTVIAQILIGSSLGSRFEPSFCHGSRPLLVGVVSSGVLTVGLSVILALIIARLAGMSIPMLVLATAPGGVSEMCLTAKILKLGVPLVTSFQVTRLALVVTFSLPVWQLLNAAKTRYSASYS